MKITYTLTLAYPALLGALLSSAAAAADGPTIVKDPYEARAESRLHERYQEIDKIDPFSGNLVIHQRDVMLRSSGGLEFSLDRNYDASRVFFGPKWLQGVGYSAKHVGMGWGWSLAFAPKLTVSGVPIGVERNVGVEQYDPACGKSSAGTSYVTYSVEHTNGHTEAVFQTADGTFRSASNWKLSCSGTSYSLTSPSGVLYEMGARTSLIISYENANNPAYNDDTRPAQQLLLNATKISDRYGNWFAIAYTGYPNPPIYQYEKYPTLWAAKLPNQVTSSDGQVLQLYYDAPIAGSSYSSPGRTARLRQVVRSDNSTWEYRYTNIPTQTYNEGLGVIQVNPPSQIYSHLSEVVRPDGQSWKFSYFDHVPYDNAVDGPASLSISSRRGASDKLKQIVAPAGGTIDYEYETSEAYAMYNPNWEPNDNTMEVQQDGVSQNLRVIKRSTSDGGNWTYTYTPGHNAGEYDLTQVNGPDGVTQYKHIGVNFYNFSDTNSLGPMFVWGYGKEARDVGWQIGMLAEKRVNNNQIETYVWSSRPYGKTGTQNIVYGRIGMVDSPVKLPALTSKTVTLDGASYTSSYDGYDVYGNVGKITEAGPNGGNRVTTLTYNINPAKWVVNQVKDEQYTGSSVTRTFDTNANLLSMNQDGVITSYTYDSNGNLATAVFPRSLTHRYASYKRGIPQSETLPEGVSLSREVDDVGNVTSETNGEGRVTRYAYDGLDRPTSVTYPAGNAKSLSYDANSRTVTRGSLVEKTVFDGFDRITSITLGGIATSYEYDALGRRTFVSNPGASIGTHYRYDALGREIEERNSDNTYQATAYGAATRTVTDERGNASVYTYRAYGNAERQLLMSVSAPVAAASFTLTRNSKDLVTSVTQGGYTRNYGYNANYYLTSVTNPETGTTTYGRDEAGNMTTRAVGSSGTTTYTYDGLNRLSTVTYPGTTPAVTNTYTKTNKLQTVSSSAATHTLGYDANGNLTSESAVVDGITLSLGYGYNANDQLSTLTYPRSGKVLSYVPDALGRPTQVGSYISAIEYWPSGQIKRLTYGNGTVASYGQNERMWPSSFGVQKSATAYLNTSYAYDGGGNLQTISDTVDSTLNRTLDYDAINRLVKADGPWGAGSISYDGVGNITRQSFGASSWVYSYDGSNRLATISGNQNLSFTYDAYGDIATTRGRTFTYDGAPNLRCVDCTDSARKTEYVYDGRNRRIAVTKAGVKTYELYNSQGNLMIEYTPSQQNKLVEYIYVGGKRVAQRVTP